MRIESIGMKQENLGWLSLQELSRGALKESKSFVEMLEVGESDVLPLSGVPVSQVISPGISPLFIVEGDWCYEIAR